MNHKISLLVSVTLTIIDFDADYSTAVLDILMHQTCPKIFVGNPHQQICSFRGAVNAIDLIEPTHSYYLTKVENTCELFSPVLWVVLSCSPSGLVPISRSLPLWCWVNWRQCINRRYWWTTGWWERERGSEWVSEGVTYYHPVHRLRAGSKWLYTASEKKCCSLQQGLIHLTVQRWSCVILILVADNCTGWY